MSSPPSRCSSTDAAAPSGWIPCETWPSCCGSPSRTTLRAHVPSASASASETCPASSTNSVSTTPAMSSRAEEPGRAGEQQHVVAPAPEKCVLRSPSVVTNGALVGVALLQPAERDALARGGLSTSSSRLWIALWLVAVTPTRRPRPIRCDDQPRAGVGLARAGRPLDRRGGGRRGRRRAPSQRRGRPARSGAGERLAQRGSTSTPGSASSPASTERASAPQRRLLRLGVGTGPPGISAAGSGIVLERRAAPQPERAVLLVERVDRPGRPAGRRVEDGVARRRGGAAAPGSVNGQTSDCRRADRRPRRLEPADRVGVALLQLLARSSDPVEERPPDRLLLAAVVEQQLREQPARPVGLGDLVRVVGQRRRAAPRGAPRSRRASSRRLARLPRLRAAAAPPGPQRQQPVAQLRGRDAVLLVVGGDLVEDLRVVLARASPRRARSSRRRRAGRRAARSRTSRPA